MRRRLSGGLSLFVITSLLLACGEGVGSTGPEREPGQGGEVVVTEMAPTMIAMLAETPQPAAVASPSPEVEMNKIVTPLTLNNVKDAPSIKAMIADYESSELYWYHNYADLEVSSGDESGLTFMAGFEALDPDGNTVGKLAWLRGTSTENVIAAKLSGDIGWVVPYRLGQVKIEGSNQVVEMYGYSTGTDTILVYGVNMDADGKPMPGGVFCYFDENTPEGVCNPISTGEDRGKLGFADMAPELNDDLVKTETILKEMGADTSEWVISYNEEWGEESELGYWLAQDVFMSVSGQDVEMRLADGSIVTIPRDKIKHNDKGSFDFVGYKWDKTANDGAGAWVVEVNETVTMGNVILTLDENGVVTDMEATGASEEIKAENLAKVDPKAWGFEAGEAQIVKDATGTHIVVDGENVADWHFASNEWEWDWAALKELAGGNPLFELAKTWEMVGTNPVDMTEAKLDSSKLDSYASSEAAKKGNQPMVSAVFVYSDDRSEAIGGFLIAGTNVKSSEDSERVDRSKGELCFITDSGNVVSVRVRNFDSEIRYWG